MADKSAIEWTDSTWTPIRARNKKTGAVGWHCEHATTACEFCYAENFNRRLGTGLPFKPGHRNNIELFLDRDILLQPLRWRRPRKVFPCSMTDIFADFVPADWLDQMFAVMALTPQHTYQVLTKRAERMRQYMSAARAHPVGLQALGLVLEEHARDPKSRIGDGVILQGDIAHLKVWPLPNVWLGVSTERQREADVRIPHLLQTPAAVRFISAEPLLGPIDSTRLCVGESESEFYNMPEIKRARFVIDGLRGVDSFKWPGLDWVIVGGESGPKARPMSIQWARELRDQCAAAGVPFFFKQWGEWAPTGARRSGDPGRFAFGDYDHDRSTMIEVDEYPRAFTRFGARSIVERVGKKRAGRTLDGRTHSEFPTRDHSDGI